MKVWFLFRVVIFPYWGVKLHRKAIFSYLIARTDLIFMPRLIGLWILLLTFAETISQIVFMSTRAQCSSAAELVAVRPGEEDSALCSIRGWWADHFIAYISFCQPDLCAQTLSSGAGKMCPECHVDHKMLKHSLNQSEASINPLVTNRRT